MADVFISYSSKDRLWAERVRQVLTLNNISYWIAPDHIPGGSNYSREIPIAIKNCKVFLLLLSDFSSKSPWVRKELDTAISEEKLIIPLKGNSKEISSEFAFLLNGVQHYEAIYGEDPTGAVLVQIKQVIETPSSDNNTIDLSSKTQKNTHVCPRCHCSNITIDEDAKNLFDRLWAATSYGWLCLLPMITILLILMIVDFADNDPNKRYIKVIGLTLSLISFLIMIIKIILPTLIDQHYLQKNIVRQRSCCCRCGHHFILNIPNDNS